MGADSVNAEIGFGEFLENNKQILDSLIIAGGWATEIQLAEDNVPISQKREHHDVDYILLNPTAQPYVKTGLDGFPLVAGDICYLPSTYGKSIFIPDSNWLEPFIERRNIIYEFQPYQVNILSSEFLIVTKSFAAYRSATPKQNQDLEMLFNRTNLNPDAIGFLMRSASLLCENSNFLYLMNERFGIGFNEEQLVKDRFIELYGQEDFVHGASLSQLRELEKLYVFSYGEYRLNNLSSEKIMGLIIQMEVNRNFQAVPALSNYSEILDTIKNQFPIEDQQRIMDNALLYEPKQAKIYLASL